MGATTIAMLLLVSRGRSGGGGACAALLRRFSAATQRFVRRRSSVVAPAAAAAAGTAHRCKPNEGFSVAVELMPSPLGGRGLFAAEPIAKDALIWTFSAANCRTFATEQEVRGRLRGLPTKEAIADFLAHAYVEGDAVVEILDNGRFWNHSGSVPNTGSPAHDLCNTYALRDIVRGEELLCDYGTFPVLDWYERVCIEFGTESLAELAARVH